MEDHVETDGVAVDRAQGGAGKFPERTQPHGR
jgi:hypothetical protein